jgi:hypothetical protein
MVKVVLLVTFVLPGQAPYAFHIDNMSQRRCDSAKERLEREYELRFSKLAGAYSIVCLETTDISN